MKLSTDNRRLSISDNPELALTTAQQKVFANWEAGFEAHFRGIPFEGHPHPDHWAHKVRKVWKEGWLASAAVEKFKSEFLAPLHHQNA
jgi:hypothetical protein